MVQDRQSPTTVRVVAVEPRVVRQGGELCGCRSMVRHCAGPVRFHEHDDGGWAGCEARVEKGLEGATDEMSA